MMTSKNNLVQLVLSRTIKKRTPQKFGSIKTVIVVKERAKQLLLMMTRQRLLLPLSGLIKKKFLET